MNPYTGYPPPYNLESSNNDASSSFEFSSNQDYPKTSHTMRWKSGKTVGPRLPNMLEQVGEIYEERHELFSKIFHGDREEVVHKFGSALKKKKQMKKAGSMKRSMRALSRRRGIQQQTVANELTLQRFKVKTPIVIEAAEDDAQGNQATKGSK